MSLYVVHIVPGRHRTNPSKAPMFVVYEGNDRHEAEQACSNILSSGKHEGIVLAHAWVRFYDFHLFGGGMSDYEIKGVT